MNWKLKMRFENLTKMFWLLILRSDDYSKRSISSDFEVQQLWHLRFPNCIIMKHKHIFWAWSTIIWGSENVVECSGFKIILLLQLTLLIYVEVIQVSWEFIMIFHFIDFNCSIPQLQLYFLNIKTTCFNEIWSPYFKRYKVQIQVTVLTAYDSIFL